jgi:hypothetical protein
MGKHLLDALEARYSVPLELAKQSANTQALLHTTVPNVRDFVYLTISNANDHDVDVLLRVGGTSQPPVRVRASGRQYSPVPAMQNRAIGGRSNTVTLHASLDTPTVGATSGVHVYGFIIRA